MSENEQDRGFGERMTDAYHRMLERVKHAVEQAEADTGPVVRHAIDNAKETATELGELSREEAEKVGNYLRRDLQDAAEFLSDSGKELGGWLRFDLDLVERSLANMFMAAVDKTRVELAQFSQRADALGEWHTGEVAGIGTLQCKSCGEVLRFHKIGHIPPCPKCHGSRYRRISHSDE